jgi:protein deglycase
MEDLKMKAKRTLLLLADGFEEIEAVTPADVLRRLGYEVVLAGLETELVRGSHNIVFKADAKFADLKIEDFDALFLPGGMPGAENLRGSDLVMEAIKKMEAKGGIVSAICAAPIALGRAGVIQGRKVTAYPGYNSRLEGASYTGNRTERDGHILTGKGPGASFDFAIELAAALGTPRGDIKKLMDAMFVNT